MYMNDGNKTKINLRNKSVFITGVAGFIGSNLAKRLLSTVEDVKVVGLDNMNHYYDVRLKEARLNELEQFENFSFVKGNLADKSVIEAICTFCAKALLLELCVYYKTLAGKLHPPYLLTGAENRDTIKETTFLRQQATRKTNYGSRTAQKIRQCAPRRNRESGRHD